MGLKSFLGKWYAKTVVKRISTQYHHPEKLQKRVLKNLISSAKQTTFGKDHSFSTIEHYEQFAAQVPLATYEGLKPYVDRALEGESNVLWKGKPIYFCKTSGTTSGAKFIPISKESIHNHINSAKNALLSYIAETGKADFLDGKMMFLQGSPVLEKINGIHVGRLSGIVAHHVPKYLQGNRVPSWKTNCIDDWEQKVEAIAKETVPQDMRLISGIPSWLQMYFDYVLKESKASTIADVFPNLSLFVHGGVNFEPYAPVFRKYIGKDIPSVETYPASEGFMAYQNSQVEPGLLLVIDDGIFYEFIPLDSYGKEHQKRIPLWEVELGVNYAIVLNTNAGLWGYVIGDTVKFVSKNPYKIVVTGRIAHYTSAFGEHVIAEEVESAIRMAQAKHPIEMHEFHVAPQVTPNDGLPYHEWFIETPSSKQDLNAFAAALDIAMQSLNPYYKDLITGSVLRPLVVTSIPVGGFNAAMKARGKLGGQNKIPRLSNDREFANLLTQ